MRTSFKKKCMHACVRLGKASRGRMARCRPQPVEALLALFPTLQHGELRGLLATGFCATVFVCQTKLKITECNSKEPKQDRDTRTGHRGGNARTNEKQKPFNQTNVARKRQRFYYRRTWMVHQQPSYYVHMRQLLTHPLQDPSWPRAPLYK